MFDSSVLRLRVGRNHKQGGRGGNRVRRKINTDML